MGGHTVHCKKMLSAELPSELGAGTQSLSDKASMPENKKAFADILYLQTLLGK